MADNERALDSDLLRARVLERLRSEPDDAHARALRALSGGAFTIDDHPDAGVIEVTIGDLSIVVDRSDCIRTASRRHWTVASERAGEVAVTTGRLGRRTTKTTRVPQGRIHACRPGDTAALCGVDVGDLHVWDDLEFGPTMLNLCDQCRLVANRTPPA